MFRAFNRIVKEHENNFAVGMKNNKTPQGHVRNGPRDLCESGGFQWAGKPQLYDRHGDASWLDFIPKLAGTEERNSSAYQGCKHVFLVFFLKEN